VKGSAGGVKVGKGVGEGSAVAVAAAVVGILALTAVSLFAGVPDGSTSTRAKDGGSVGTAVGASTHCTGLANVAVGAGSVAVSVAAGIAAVSAWQALRSSSANRSKIKEMRNVFPSLLLPQFRV